MAYVTEWRMVHRTCLVSSQVVVCPVPHNHAIVGSALQLFRLQTWLSQSALMKWDTPGQPTSVVPGPKATVGMLHSYCGRAGSLGSGYRHGLLLLAEGAPVSALVPIGCVALLLSCTRNYLALRNLYALV